MFICVMYVITSHRIADAIIHHVRMHAPCRAARTRRVVPRRRFVCAYAVGGLSTGGYLSNASPTGYNKFTDAATCDTALAAMPCWDANSHTLALYAESM